MGTLLYIRLIGYTAGSLLMLFWIVVILGYRRQRNFERVFFFLCLALFLFYGGSLLALNAEIYYNRMPPFIAIFSQLLLVLGLGTLPALLLHLHIEYANARALTPRKPARAAWMIGAYLPLLSVAFLTRRLVTDGPFDFSTPINAFGYIYKIWLVAVLVACAWWQRRFLKATAVEAQRQFHIWAAAWLALAALVVFAVHLGGQAMRWPEGFGTGLALFPLPAFGALAYFVEKHNFLQIGRQRNLV